MFHDIETGLKFKRGFCEVGYRETEVLCFFFLPSFGYCGIG